MSDPKNQHIIPQCYLKQFVDLGTPTGHEPYVWIFERKAKKGKNEHQKISLQRLIFIHSRVIM